MLCLRCLEKHKQETSKNENKRADQALFGETVKLTLANNIRASNILCRGAREAHLAISDVVLARVAASVEVLDAARCVLTGALYRPDPRRHLAARHVPGATDALVECLVMATAMSNRTICLARRLGKMSRKLHSTACRSWWCRPRQSGVQAQTPHPHRAEPQAINVSPCIAPPLLTPPLPSARPAATPLAMGVKRWSRATLFGGSPLSQLTLIAP